MSPNRPPSRATGSAASPALCLRCNKTTTATALFTVLVLAAWLYSGDPSKGDVWWPAVTAAPYVASSSDPGSPRRRLADGYPSPGKLAGKEEIEYCDSEQNHHRKKNEVQLATIDVPTRIRYRQADPP